ncbi:MAG: NUDIX domain-containing protein [Candidatus Paceibacterota bacterium]
MPHIHDRIDYTVEVFIVHKDTILLHQHKKLNKWLSIGGHVELDEDPEVACHREVKEEMGLEIELVPERETKKFNTSHELPQPFAVNRNPITDTHDHITFVYFARTNTDQVTPEEGITEWKWFAKEDLEENGDGVPDDIRYYALKALDVLSS